jgi:hypothetical protein
MDRRKFLERMVVAASVAAVTPIIRDAIPSVEGKEAAEGESLPAFPIQDRLIASRTDQSELARRFVHPPESAAPWVYWMWINIDTTPAAMTFDLYAQNRSSPFSRCGRPGDPRCRRILDARCHRSHVENGCKWASCLEPALRKMENSEVFPGPNRRPRDWRWPTQTHGRAGTANSDRGLLIRP